MFCCYDITKSLPKYAEVQPILKQDNFLYVTFTYKSQNGGNQTSFKYLLASFMPVTRVYNPPHDSGIKKKVNFYTLDIDTYIIPLMRAEEAAAYRTAYSIPAFIGCFTYPQKLSHVQLFQVQNMQRHLLSGDILALLHQVVLASPGTRLKSKMLFISSKCKYSFELRYL